MIYIVEDDPSIRELEQYALSQNNFEVMGFGSSAGFWKALADHTPELIILDVMLPGEDGFSILKKLRSDPMHAHLPVIMVTAKTSELDTVKGLDCGADDYLAKPFGIMEFISRVKAALRRTSTPKTGMLVFEEIILDHAKHSITVSGEPVELTYKEYSLLKLLMEQPEMVVSREKILQLIWDTDIPVESRTVDMHLRTLRKKLGDAGRYVQTVRKVGYKLTINEEEKK